MKSWIGWNAVVCGIALGTFACGPSGNGVVDEPGTPPNLPPQAIVQFPMTDIVTDAPEITVTGSAFDLNGVASVRVNGVLASTTDGFSNWSAKVPLSIGGVRMLTVRTEDQLGAVDLTAAQVQVERRACIPARLGGIFFDTVRNRILSIDEAGGALYRMSTIAGAACNLVSGDGSGLGPSFGALGGLDYSITLDEAVITGADGDLWRVQLVDGRRTRFTTNYSGTFGDLAYSTISNGAYVVDPVANRLLAVQLNTTDDTGVVTVLTSSDASLTQPRGVAFHTVTGQLLLSDATGKLVSFDTNTGAREELSGPTRGTGPAFGSPHGVTVHFASRRAFVTDVGRKAIFEVDLLSGDRRIVADGVGPDLVFPVSVRVDQAAGRLWVSDPAARSLVSVDLGTGNRISIFGSAVGAGPSLTRLTGVAKLEELNTLFVIDAETKSIYNVRPSDGQRSLVSGPSMGSGLQLVQPRALVAEAFGLPGGNLMLLDDGKNAAVRVRTSTGERSVVTGSATGSGPALVRPSDMDTRTTILFPPSALEAYVADRGNGNDGPAVLGVALEDGARQILSGRGIGRGAPLVDPAALVFDTLALRILIVDTATDLLVTIDPDTGDRIALSSPGQGPSLVETVDLRFDRGSNRAQVLTADRLIAIDLDTGKREVMSGPERGGGPSFVKPNSLSYDAIRRIAWIADEGRGLMAIEAVSGDRVLRAR